MSETPAVMTGAIPTAEQAAIIAEVAQSVGIADPRWLTAVMDHESNLRTTAENQLSGATGLIQFLGSTAAALLGLNAKAEEDRAEALRRVRLMSFQGQMELVRKYLTAWKGRYRTGLDVALAVFYPAAIGDYGYVIAKRGQKAYEWNKALDKDGKGVITPTDYARSLMKFALRHGVNMSPVDGYLVANAAAKTLADLLKLVDRIVVENPKHPREAWERVRSSIQKSATKYGETHSTTIKLDGGDSFDYRKTLDAQIRAAFRVQTEYTVTKYVTENPLEAAKGVVETTARQVEKIGDVMSSPGTLVGVAIAAIAGVLLFRKL